MKELACIKSGRAGDVLGILPCLKYLSENGPKPTLIVAAEYAHAAAYCSYIDIEVSPMPFEACIRMAAKARKEYKRVLDFSVYGHSLAYNRVAQHFTSEAHHRAGHEYGRMYDQGHFRNLVFDKPITAASHVSSGLTYPTVGVCFNGNSSPLPESAAWKDFICMGLNGAGISVIDIGAIRMNSVIELLPTINTCKAILSLDTSLLHLMAASKTPYIALRNDLWDRWYAAPVHSNCAMSVWYSEAPSKRQQVLEEIIKLCHQ